MHSTYREFCSKVSKIISSDQTEFGLKIKFGRAISRSDLLNLFDQAEGGVSSSVSETKFELKSKLEMCLSCGIVVRKNDYRAHVPHVHFANSYDRFRSLIEDLFYAETGVNVDLEKLEPCICWHHFNDAGKEQVHQDTDKKRSITGMFNFGTPDISKYLFQSDGNLVTAESFIPNFTYLLIDGLTDKDFNLIVETRSTGESVTELLLDRVRHNPSIFSSARSIRRENQSRVKVLEVISRYTREGEPVRSLAAHVAQLRLLLQLLKGGYSPDKTFKMSGQWIGSLSKRVSFGAFVLAFLDTMVEMAPLDVSHEEIEQCFLEILEAYKPL